MVVMTHCQNTSLKAVHRKEMKPHIIISAILALTSGCAVKSYQYKYISLEHLANIEVTAYGRADLAGLEFDSEMPISYELARDQYLLTFQIELKSYWPSILVLAKSATGSGQSLSVEPLTVGNCGRFENLPLQYSINGLPARKYTWSPAFNQECPVAGNEDLPDQQYISFRVLGLEGMAVGEERLAFELIENGQYTEIDAL